MLRGLIIPLITSFASIVSAATLSGSASITPQDYYGLRMYPLTTQHVKTN